MANCNDLFQEYLVELNILKSKKEKMITAKNKLRQKIRDHFKENHPEYEPTFWIQGSYKLGSAIRNEDDTCDLDDGVYFEREPEVTGTTLQQWVYDAVKDHTDGGAQHRKKCIRVIYKGDFHIDLPVYYKTDENLHPFLAVKNSNWEKSDPKEFITWFNDNKDIEGQLIKIIKYLKGWCDDQSHNMPSGLCMTVLAERNFVQSSERDDISLRDTLKNIRNSLQQNWECKMPTTPKDDIFMKYNEDLKDRFLDALDKFISNAEDAISTTSRSESSRLWRSHLGNRFPKVEDDESEGKNSIGLAGIATARPWLNG